MAAAAARAAGVILGVLGGVGGCELALLGVVELLPSRAAESIPVEEGIGEASLLGSSTGGLDSAIENDSV